VICPQFILDLNEELIVDNFAGGGGASTGIEMALGRHVDHAINHSREALGMHRINHPQTIHHCEDVFDIDPRTLCEGRPVGLAHFSPDCKHFSKAKGGKPLDKRIRGLVLIMLRWAKYGARVMTMENVEEITTWGPLIRLWKNNAWGWYPDVEHKGRTWLAFLDILSTGIDPTHPDLKEIVDVLGGTVTREECIRGFGYQYEARQIRACDFGSPTIRKRLYMIARRDGREIVWPDATHFSTSRAAGSRWRTIAECIDWNRPCPSIFLTKQEARAARCKRPLVKATCRRIAMGIDRYVIKSKKPFLVSVTHQGDDRIYPVDEPARTITAAHRGEKALVAPTVSRFNGNHQGREDGATRNYPVEEPISVQDTSNRFALSEAKLAPFVTEHANASSQRNMPADEPMRTACGEVKGGHFAVVSANLMVNTSGHSGAPADAAAPTVTTGGHHALVTGALVQTGYGEREGQAPRALDPQKPLGTVVAGGGKHGVVTGVLVGAGGPAYSGKPKPVDAPMNAQTTENHASLVSATLIHTAHGDRDASGKKRGRGAHDVQESMPSVLASSDCGLAAASLVKLSGNPQTHPGQSVETPCAAVRAEGQHIGIIAASVVRHFGESIGQEVDAPAPTTVSGGGGKTGVIAAHLTKFVTGAVGSSMDDPAPTNPGHPADSPASTISTKGSQQQVVAASVAAYYGTEKDGQAIDEPARTSTAKARLGFVESTAVAPMTEEQVFGARRVAAFLREYGVEFEGEFATVCGYVIVDIGMRMLTPRELFRAQGFDDQYIIDRAWVVDPATAALTEIYLTKEQQIRMCGNSVAPQVMEALIKANAAELAVGRTV
jgi:DNA (cytosine-5)-methyltransferase 1